MFSDIIYILYDIFFDILDETNLYLLSVMSSEINKMILSNGGICKYLQYNNKTTLPLILNRMKIHSKIESLDYFDAGWNGITESPFAFFPFNSTNIKILIMRDPYMSLFTNNQQFIKLEYIFIIDNNEQTFDFNTQQYPNVRMIGLYKAKINVTGEPKPLILTFKDNSAITSIISLNYNKMTSVYKNLIN